MSKYSGYTYWFWGDVIYHKHRKETIDYDMDISVKKYSVFVFKRKDLVTSKICQNSILLMNKLLKSV